MSITASDADLESAMRRRAALLLDPEMERREKPLWTPFPKQAIASELASVADETLFGGAAGPGKTHWGLHYSIDQCELYPGNYVGIFRRVFPSLQRTVIPRLRAILSKRIDPATGMLAEGKRANDRTLPTRAVYNENKKMFLFPNDSILEVASLQYAHTVHDFQGTEFGLIFFEELTEFLKEQWEYLLGRLRSLNPEIRPHAIATTNPGNVGHRWVKRRFIKPEPEDLESGSQVPTPMTVWKPKFDPDVHSEDAPPLSRAYIPSVYTDNPKLLKNDPTYISRLRANTKKGFREALEHGDWDAIDAVDGAQWTQENNERGRVERNYFRNHIRPLITRRVIALDPNDANEDETSGHDAFGVVVCSRDRNGEGYVEEAFEWHLSTGGLVQAVTKLADRCGADALVCERNHGGKWMINSFPLLGCQYPIYPVWASDSKRTRAEPISGLFEPNEYRETEIIAHLVGKLPKLEEELITTSFVSGEPSPNLLDAMVWGLWFLFIAEVEAFKSDGMNRGERLRGRR